MRIWRRWAAPAVVLLLAGALVARWSDVAAAWEQLAGLSGASLAALACLAAAATLANGLVAAAITDGVSPVRGVMVQQAALAANNTGVGSGPVTLGVRIAMLRSWRVDEIGIAVAVAAVNVVGTTRLWLATLAVSLLGIGGAADAVVDRWVIVAAGISAVVVLVGQASVWWLVLQHPGVLARAGRWCQRAAERLGRRWAPPGAPPAGSTSPSSPSSSVSRRAPPSASAASRSAPRCSPSRRCSCCCRSSRCERSASAPTSCPSERSSSRSCSCAQRRRSPRSPAASASPRSA